MIQPSTPCSTRSRRPASLREGAAASKHSFALVTQAELRVILSGSLDEFRRNLRQWFIGNGWLLCSAHDRINAVDPYPVALLIVALHEAGLLAGMDDFIARTLFSRLCGQREHESNGEGAERSRKN